ncbi:MAG: glycosyltransferase [Opitutus sp.]
MTVSFIIPLYNCLALTQAMVASLQATMPRDVAPEIILVDDGSTDGTRSWLQTLAPPFRVILNEVNLGYAGANNRGAAVATGEVLVLLNNDLVLTRRWLEPMLAAYRQLGARAGVIGNVQRRADTGAVDHSGVFINFKGKPEHQRSLLPGWLRWVRPVVPVAAVTGACALTNRELWEKLGGFDEHFVNGGEDVDYCFRVAREGRVNAVALRSVIRHHVSASPGRKRRDEENSRRLAQKWRPELEQLALRQWCWHYLHENWNAPQGAADHATARAALFYAMHLRASPPHLAVTGMHAAMNREMDRWSRLLD